MIIVSVQLLSARGREFDKELARMEICNEGGSNTRGEYGCRTLRGRDKASLDKRSTNRTGQVLNYPRLAIHVWHLISEALEAMGYARRGRKEAPFDDPEN